MVAIKWIEKKDFENEYINIFYFIFIVISLYVMLYFIYFHFQGIFQEQQKVEYTIFELWLMESIKKMCQWIPKESSFKAQIWSDPQNRLNRGV